MTVTTTQVLQRAAGFFAGHNDNYTVSWADASRSTNKLMIRRWIMPRYQDDLRRGGGPQQAPSSRLQCGVHPMAKQEGHREHLLPSLHPHPHLHRLDHRDRRPCDGSRFPKRVKRSRFCPLHLLRVGGDHPPAGPHPQDLLCPLVQHPRPRRRLLDLHHLLRCSGQHRGHNRILCTVHRPTRGAHHQDCQNLLWEAKPRDWC